MIRGSRGKEKMRLDLCRNLSEAGEMGFFPLVVLGIVAEYGIISRNYCCSIT